MVFLKSELFSNIPLCPHNCFQYPSENLEKGFTGTHSNTTMYRQILWEVIIDIQSFVLLAMETKERQVSMREMAKDHEERTSRFSEEVDQKEGFTLVRVHDEPVEEVEPQIDPTTLKGLRVEDMFKLATFSLVFIQVAVIILFAKCSKIGYVEDFAKLYQMFTGIEIMVIIILRISVGLLTFVNSTVDIDVFWVWVLNGMLNEMFVSALTTLRVDFFEAIWDGSCWFHHADHSRWSSMGYTDRGKAQQMLYCIHYTKVNTDDDGKRLSIGVVFILLGILQAVVCQRMGIHPYRPHGRSRRSFPSGLSADFIRSNHWESEPIAACHHDILRGHLLFSEQGCTSPWCRRSC